MSLLGFNLTRWNNMEQRELKPCPCGKIPESLHISGDDSKWKYVSGMCCNEWEIEFRTHYQEGDKLMNTAIDAWNNATRHERRELDEKSLYKFLRSIDGCNTEWIDSNFADNVDLKALAKAICNHFTAPTLSEEVKRYLNRVEEIMQHFPQNEISQQLFGEWLKLEKALAKYEVKND